MSCERKQSDIPAPDPRTPDAEQNNKIKNLIPILSSLTRSSSFEGVTTGLQPDSRDDVVRPRFDPQIPNHFHQPLANHMSLRSTPGPCTIFRTFRK